MTRKLAKGRNAGVNGVAGWLVMAVLALSGCEANDFVPQPLIDASDLFWTLEVDHRAVTLAMAEPYDTLMLTAIPRNNEGKHLQGLPRPTFKSADSERLLVSPEGLLIAVAPTSKRVGVAVRLTSGNLTHSDTVWVTVLPATDLPVLDGFSITPVAPDSTKVATQAGQGGNCGYLPLVLTDVNGVSLLGKKLPVAVSSSDTSTIQIVNTARFLEGRDFPQSCDVGGKRPGVATVYASTTVLGVHKADTVPYRIGWPLYGYVNVVPAPDGRPGNVFIERELKIGTGGLVAWKNLVSDSLPVTVVVDDSTTMLSLHDRPTAFEDGLILLICMLTGADCGKSGTMTVIPTEALGHGAYRIFPVPGTFSFHDPVSGDRVRIIVIDER